MLFQELVRLEHPLAYSNRPGPLSNLAVEFVVVQMKGSRLESKGGWPLQLSGMRNQGQWNRITKRARLNKLTLI